MSVHSDALAAAPQPEAEGETGHGSTYDRLHTFLYDRDRAIAGDPYSADEMDESVRAILSLIAASRRGDGQALAQPADGCSSNEGAA